MHRSLLFVVCYPQAPHALLVLKRRSTTLYLLREGRGRSRLFKSSEQITSAREGAALKGDNRGKRGGGIEARGSTAACHRWGWTARCQRRPT